AANSWDQANKLFGAAAVMCGGQGRKVLESPLREFFEVYDSKILRADVGEGRARLHLVIGKSTKKRRLRCEIPQKDGPPKVIERGSGRIIDISTAGFDVDHS